MSSVKPELSNSLSSVEVDRYLANATSFPLDIQPTPPHIGYGIGHNQITQSEGGLYDRTDLPVAVDPPRDLVTWQYWQQTSWKTAHGSTSSVDRFISKLHEEYGELDDIAAVAAVDQSPSVIKEFLSEAGDFGWCLGAIASSASVSMDRGVKALLYRSAQDTVGLTPTDDVVEPSWHGLAVAKANLRNQSMTFEDIDELLEAGFVTEPDNPHGPFYIRDEYEAQPDPMRYMRTMRQESRILTTILEKQYGLNGGEQPDFVGNITYQALGREVEQLAAKMLVQTAYIARCIGHCSFQDVIDANFAKLTERVFRGTVDKVDGPRQ